MASKNFVVEEAILSYKFISTLTGVESLDITLQVYIKCNICGWLYLYKHTAANQDIVLEED